MGIYIYTLRAATKRLGGHEIGQFKFGWKSFWGDDKDRTVRSLIAAGERAKDKLDRKACKLFVQGSWGEDQSVHYSSRAFSTLTEEFTSCPHVGWLRKDSGGRWYLHLKSEAQLLAEYPEIGVLQTETGKKYYFTDPTSSHQFPPDHELWQVVTNEIGRAHV